MKIISSVKGMNDIMPEETAYWNMVENIWYEVIKSYCYDEVRTPVLENLELFYSWTTDRYSIKRIIYFFR